MTDFRPVREFGEWPVLEAQPFDTRASTFIPDLSIDTSKVRELSAERVRGIGIKVYDANGSASNTAIVDSTDTSVNFTTVDFAEGFDSPTGATFTTVTIPRDGVYLCIGTVEWNYAGVNADTSLHFYVNGAKEEGVAARVGTIKPRNTLAVPKVMTAGDTLGLRVRHEDSVAANRDLEDGEFDCALSAIYLFGI